jgi:hypothetical protein
VSRSSLHFLRSAAAKSHVAQRRRPDLQARVPKGREPQRFLVRHVLSVAWLRAAKVLQVCCKRQKPLFPHHRGAGRRQRARKSSWKMMESWSRTAAWSTRAPRGALPAVTPVAAAAVIILTQPSAHTASTSAIQPDWGGDACASVFLATVGRVSTTWDGISPECKRPRW